MLYSVAKKVLLEQVRAQRVPAGFFRGTDTVLALLGWIEGPGRAAVIAELSVRTSPLSVALSRVLSALLVLVSSVSRVGLERGARGLVPTSIGELYDRLGAGGWPVLSSVSLQELGLLLRALWGELELLRSKQ